MSFANTSLYRVARSAVVLGFAALLGTGCVPYQKYRDTVSLLEKAKAANADLIKKYNTLTAKYLALGGDAANPAQVAALKEQIRQLQEQLNRDAPEFAFKEDEIPAEARREGAGGIAFPDQLLFTPGSAKLKTTASPALDQIVDLLRTNYSTERVVIEGHCDNQPLRATEKLWTDNMNLSYNRARAVFEYFKSRGVPEERMIVHAYSYNKPVDPTTVNTSEGRRLNRRVVVRRTGQQIFPTATAMRD